MKKQKRKVILIMILVFILGIFLLFQNKKNFDSNFQDEIIFFKLFSSKRSSNNITKLTTQVNQEYQQYKFQVSFRNIEFKDVNLLDTIKKDTLIHEKIAPGTKGAFEIILETSEKIHYQIKFESKNKKPENLVFQIEGKDRKYKRLEEMEAELQGEIKKNKRVVINWKWEYETNEIQNWQDTKDGEMIKQYNFIIYVIAE